jgi:hypothetical protein
LKFIPENPLFYTYKRGMIIFNSNKEKIEDILEERIVYVIYLDH